MTTSRLIHLDLFPNAMISGQTNDEIEATLDESEQADLAEKMDATTVDDLLGLETSVEQLKRECAVVSSERQEAAAVRRLNLFLKRNGSLQTDPTVCCSEELGRVLRSKT